MCSVCNHWPNFLARTCCCKLMANASCRPSVLLGRERGEREYPADKFVVTGKIRRINNLEISKVVSDGKISLQGRHNKKNMSRSGGIGAG